MLRPLPLRRTATSLAVAALVGLSGAAAAPASAAGTQENPVGGAALGSRGVVVSLGPDAAALPAVAAKSWVLADLTTGEVLAAKNAHRTGRPASTMKTLTALTLMRVLDKDAEHVATWKEATAEGGRVGIVPDASYTIWDLYHGLLLPSGNDAAAALADANGGMRKTVTDMQAVAADLQARDTVVKNASGLDADGMVTSAYDLALIARAALAEEQFAEVTQSISYDFPGRPKKSGKVPTYKIYTQNRLLLHGYKGTIGGKTGWTTKAGRTFWGAAERGGHALVVAILQSTERTETAATSLLSWGFANRSKVTPVGTLVEPLSSQPQPTGSPTAAAPVDVPAGGAAVASPATTTGRSPGLWLVIGAGLAALGATLVWWRRSGSGRRSADAALARVAASGPAGPATPPSAAPPVLDPPAAETAAAPAPSPAPPSPAPPRPAPVPPVTAGHVKVIAPPTRAPRD